MKKEFLLIEIRREIQAQKNKLSKETEYSKKEARVTVIEAFERVEDNILKEEFATEKDCKVLNKELKLREKFYPKWIMSRRYNEQRLNVQMKRWKAIIETVQKVSKNPEIEQKLLF